MRPSLKKKDQIFGRVLVLLVVGFFLHMWALFLYILKSKRPVYLFLNSYYCSTFILFVSYGKHLKT